MEPRPSCRKCARKGLRYLYLSQGQRGYVCLKCGILYETAEPSDSQASTLRPFKSNYRLLNLQDCNADEPARCTTVEEWETLQTNFLTVCVADGYAWPLLEYYLRLFMYKGRDYLGIAAATPGFFSTRSLSAAYKDLITYYRPWTDRQWFTDRCEVLAEKIKRQNVQYTRKRFERIEGGKTTQQQQQQPQQQQPQQQPQQKKPLQACTIVLPTSAESRAYLDGGNDPNDSDDVDLEEWEFLAEYREDFEFVESTL